MKDIKEIRVIEEFTVSFPIHKYVKGMLSINPATEGDTYVTINLETNKKEYYTVYFHCHGHAFEDQDKIRKLLKQALGIGRKYLKYEAPYELEYRLTPEKYDEVNVFLKMLGY